MGMCIVSSSLSYCLHPLPGWLVRINFPHTHVGGKRLEKTRFDVVREIDRDVRNTPFFFFKSLSAALDSPCLLSSRCANNNKLSRMESHLHERSSDNGLIDDGFLCVWRRRLHSFLNIVFFFIKIKQMMMGCSYSFGR